MEVEYGTLRDIESWMDLVQQVRWNFPGLETQAALEDHRQTVLRFMGEHRALCVKAGDQVIGVLLLSKKHNMICCLAVAPEHRKKGIASALLKQALLVLDRTKNVTVTTFRENDEMGIAPRALYKRFGFTEGKLLVEFGYPVQEFVLRGKSMEITKLDSETYAGRKFTLRYMTNGYYDIQRMETGFQIAYKRFDKPTEMSFDDFFFNEWLEDPVAYGAFVNGQLIGYVEGTLEKWNNRYRISNICVFDDARRHSGIGTALISTILHEAKQSGARMVVLETQTCNENAIAFYRKNGFEIIGFDLYAYTNSDPERHEIRIEMGKQL